MDALGKVEHHSEGKEKGLDKELGKEQGFRDLEEALVKRKRPGCTRGG